MLPNISLSPNNTLSDHASIKRRNECGHGVVQNACFDQKTILSGSFGDRSWSPKKSLQQHHSAIHSSEESYGLASIFLTCNKKHAFLLLLKGGSPVGPAAAPTTTTTTTTSSATTTTTTTTTSTTGQATLSVRCDQISDPAAPHQLSDSSCTLRHRQHVEQKLQSMPEHKASCRTASLQNSVQACANQLCIPQC